MNMNRDPLIPPLRPEVELLPGPSESAGAPTGLLYDPLYGTYDKFGWAEGEILSRLRRPIGLDALHRILELETAARLEKRELTAFLGDLRRRGLLEGSRPETGGGGTFGRRLGRILFFRLPLFRPDSFLRGTLWLSRFFGSGFFTGLCVAVFIAAVFLFVPRSGMFVRDFAPFISWRGGVWLTLALAGVKTLHEFGHAYAAAARGVGVRSMGIFFMLLAPVPYCDVTDAWRLSRNERLAVSFAGVRTELAVAAFSLLGWSLLGPGAWRDICLFLCTASVASTLLANLNPGMRFDGYYLFADLLGVDNLRRAANAEARAFFRRTALGVSDNDNSKNGDKNMNRRLRALLVFYAVYACVYRLFVYAGIAIAAYRFFPKALAVFIILFEAFIFILRPAAKEAMETAAMIRKRRPTPRLLTFSAAALLILLWLVLPLPHRLRLDAVVSLTDQIVLYAPDAGKITSSAPARGGVIRAGTPLLEMESSRLENEIAEKRLEHEAALLRLEAARSVSTAAMGRERLGPAAAEAERTASLLTRLRAERDQLRVTAESDLRAFEVEDEYHAGNHVVRRAYLGRFVPTSSLPRVVAYLPEEFLGGLKAGDKALFSPNADPGNRVPVTVAKVLPQSSRDIEEPGLMGPMGGALPVSRNAEGALSPASPLYRVEAVFDAAPDGNREDGLRPGQTGILRAPGRPRSLAWDFFRKIVRKLLGESGF